MMTPQSAQNRPASTSTSQKFRWMPDWRNAGGVPKKLIVTWVKKVDMSHPPQYPPMAQKAT